MKNLFNIRNGIIFTIIISIIGLIWYIVFSYSVEFGMVEEDYYEKGLNYQDQIERIQNANQLPEPVTIINLGNHIQIKFPESLDFNSAEGQIQFFRPSDPKLDRFVNLKLDDGGQHLINVSSFDQGAWIVKLNWTKDSVEYYTEQRIFLNK